MPNLVTSLATFQAIPHAEVIISASLALLLHKIWSHPRFFGKLYEKEKSHSPEFLRRWMEKGESFLYFIIFLVISYSLVFLLPKDLMLKDIFPKLIRRFSLRFFIFLFIAIGSRLIGKKGDSFKVPLIRHLEIVICYILIALSLYYLGAFQNPIS